MALGHEYDSRPGPVRDRLLASQKEWIAFIVQLVDEGIASGEVSASVDASQFAFELMGIARAFDYGHVLLRDPNSESRAVLAFESLLRRSIITAKS
jgi:hypothetical protein